MVTVGHSVEKVERLWKWRMSENWRQSQMVMAIDTMLASERSCKTVRLQERKDRRWRSQRKVDQGDEAKEGQDIAQTLEAMLLPCRDTRRLLFSLFISSSPTLPYPHLSFDSPNQKLAYSVGWAQFPGGRVIGWKPDLKGGGG
eukprot:768749-Hanusia_phi.AAC.1